MLKIISGILLVICCLGMGLLLMAMLKFIAGILVLFFLAYLCWLPIRSLFVWSEENQDDPDPK